MYIDELEAVSMTPMNTSPLEKSSEGEEGEEVRAEEMLFLEANYQSLGEEVQNEKTRSLRPRLSISARFLERSRV